MRSLIVFQDAFPDYFSPLFYGNLPLSEPSYLALFRGLVADFPAVTGNALHRAIAVCLRRAENPFTLACERGEVPEATSPLYRAALHDCTVLHKLLTAGAESLCPDAALPLLTGGSDRQEEMAALSDGRALLDFLAEEYRANGCGIFNRQGMFQYGSTGIAAVGSPDPVVLEDFVGYEDQRSRVMENTKRLLKGLPAQNILLYGDRGSGKSSTVKAVANRYAAEGLRLVEPGLEHLERLPDLLSRIGNRGMKFILFLDDLSFNEDSRGYRILKSVLEGGVAAQPSNVLIYATSNRRHLLPEYFSDREGDEVSVRDAGEEKLSLADRFGMTVSFFRPDREGYLDIVRGLAERRGLSIPDGVLVEQALHWEQWGNGISPRTARQFVDQLVEN